MILSLLRDRTKALHEQVERTVDFPSRFRSVGRYASLLARFHGFYAPLEDRLAGIGGYETIGLDFGARRKAHLLRDDLLALGTGDADIDALPRCPDLPVVDDLGGVLGCLYVLEGATLGGQILRRHAEPLLGATLGRGQSFFTSYGDRVGAMWRQFCAALEGFAAANPGAESHILPAAVGTFAGLDRWVAGGAAW